VNDSKHRDAILYSFAVEPHHDRQTLERYIRQYPELAGDLIDLLSELRVTENHRVSNTNVTSDPGYEDAWKAFVASGPKPARAGKLANPFASFRGQAFTTLSVSSRIPRPILTALRDRLVEPSSIPDHIVQRLARVTDSAYEAVRMYLAEPPVIISAAQFTTQDNQSRSVLVNFEKLLEDSELTDQERADLQLP
jgi:hypothetical protein